MSECEKISGNEIIDKLQPFKCLSTDYFKHLSDELGYEGNYDIELKWAARRFVEKGLPSVGLSTPTVTINQPIYLEEELVTAWQSLWVDLKTLKLDHAVCKWIKRLESDDKIPYIVVSGPWDGILIRWAIDQLDLPVKLPESKETVLKLLVFKNWVKKYTLMS